MLPLGYRKRKEKQMSTITKITAHTIHLDTTTENGHRLLVVECPETQKPEFAQFGSDKGYYGSCPCGREI